MNIRSIKEGDIEKASIIWEKYYKEEFTLPDFIDKFLCSFVVEKYDEIVSIGGVRLVTESVVLTNKDFSVRERREALYKILEASAYITKSNDFSQLHAFVQDESWHRHLLKVGFNNTKGKSLVLEL